MTKRSSALLSLVTAVSLVAPMAALAQQQQRREAPSLSEMSAALGVSEATLKTCVPAPGKPGAKGKPERPDAAKITDCLKAENAGLTVAAVEQTLRDFAPPPRKN
ncbi:hypothetical protein EGN72_14415 [Pseudorhodobacter sp. E13]|uniref:hypothetical protein n=1 Tax=Pseudorhodobacter sp. E13 TaxID=2487931 RepID=UPI000F8E8227|nr:hypothetical protein [Pseudorhodobacter sp. E13]RUS59148.1 hypothetical protein EGN72_14415 [Pseudorhodobacter sp. E13]